MKKKLLKIGTRSVKDAKGFIWDGCHKIYVLFTDAQVRAEKGERGGDMDVLPMTEIEDVFRKSCSLRFINGIDLSDIVPQFRNRVTFTYNTGKSVVDFTK